MIQIENIYDICFILLHMPLTTPVYVIKLLHLFKLLHLAEFLHLPLTAPVYVRRLLHLAFLHLPAFLHLAVLQLYERRANDFGVISGGLRNLTCENFSTKKLNPHSHFGKKWKH